MINAHGIKSSDKGNNWPCLQCKISCHSFTDISFIMAVYREKALVAVPWSVNGAKWHQWLTPYTLSSFLNTSILWFGFPTGLLLAWSESCRSKIGVWGWQVGSQWGIVSLSFALVIYTGWLGHLGYLPCPTGKAKKAFWDTIWLCLSAALNRTTLDIAGTRIGQNQLQ